MRKLALLVLAVCSVATRAQTPPLPATRVNLTLDSAVELAMRQNIDIADAELELRAYQSRYREIRSAAIPDLSLFADYTRNFQRPLAFFGGRKTEVGERNGMQAGIELEQTLYSGGKLRAGLKAAELRMASVEAAVRATRGEVTLVVKRLFYSVLLAGETVSIREESLRSAEAHLATIRERYKQGLDSDLTVERQEVEVAAARSALSEARSHYEVGLVLLKNVLGMDIDAPVILAGGLDTPLTAPPAYEPLVRAALVRNPDYQLALKRAEAADQVTRVVAADAKPQVSLFAKYLWSAQSPDFSPVAQENGTSSALGIRMRYSFFTGGATRERIVQSNLAYQRELEGARKTERAVRVDVKRWWLAAGEALERARSQEAAVGLARHAVKVTEVRYKSGDASLLELNDATLALTRARMLLAQASYDYLVAMAALERAVGTGLEEFRS